MKKKWTERDVKESPATSVTLRNFYFTIIYDNKMYYLYDKINKAVDTSRRFSSVSFITSSCNASKFLRLPSTLHVFVVEKIARYLICYSSSSSALILRSS